MKPIFIRRPDGRSDLSRCSLGHTTNVDQPNLTQTQPDLLQLGIEPTVLTTMLSQRVLYICDSQAVKKKTLL